MSDPFGPSGNLEEYSDRWTSHHPSFWPHQSIKGGDEASTAHLVQMERRLHNLTNSANGHGSFLPIKTPEHEFSRLGIHSPLSASSQSLRGLRYMSPSGCFGGNLSSTSSDSTPSDGAASPDAAKYSAQLFHGHFDSHDTCRSPSYDGPGIGNWVPNSAYTHGLMESPSSFSHGAACNLKDLQYSPDVDLEDADDNDCIKVEVHGPEEVAYAASFTDEALGESVEDDMSLKDEDEDNNPDQDSDQDPEYNPNRPQRRMSNQVKYPGRTSPKRTRSISNVVTLGETKISKPSQRKTTTGQGRGRTAGKGPSDPNKRIFTCAFHSWGCDSTFGSKNEWKRHVSSQHLQLEFYRCDAGTCNQDSRSTSKSYNDFGRKDLFTQHHRRMHTPWAPATNPPNTRVKQEFEDSLEGVRQRCLKERRKAPQRSSCGFCRRVFEGTNSWDERMEHVGKHFEGKGGVNGAKEPQDLKEDEDEDLKEWALKEGIIKNYGSRGFWLVGHEPTGPSKRPRGRGQRVKEEDEDMDANGEADV